MTLAARVLLVGSLLLGGMVAVPAAAQEPAAEVDVVNVAFEPADVTIELGEVVRWTFVEGTHTVTADDGRFDSGTQTSNTTYDVTFNATGTFEYYCRIHSTPDGDRQNGTVTVVDQGEGPVDPEPTEPPATDPPLRWRGARACPTAARPRPSWGPRAASRTPSRRARGRACWMRRCC